MKNSSKKLLLNYRDFLRNIFPQSIGYLVNNELIIKISPKKIKRVLTFLKNHTQCQFKVLVDMCGVDYPEKKNRFEVVYNLLSISYNSRITVSVAVDEKTPIDSVTSIFSGADWLEREVWDMFGIFFLGHKDLRRILTDYGFKGHPLRKDFPLTGYVEVRYSDSEKRVITEEVSLTQDYRTFIFDNNWNTTL